MDIHHSLNTVSCDGNPSFPFIMSMDMIHVDFKIILSLMYVAEGNVAPPVHLSVPRVVNHYQEGVGEFY